MTDHLDQALYEKVRSGDPRALDVDRQVERLNEVVEALLLLGICPDCIASNVEEVLKRADSVAS
jgi:hypothetical protein